MMKRKIYLSLPLALIGLAFMACEKEAVVENNNQPTQQRVPEYRITPADMAFVGIKHNQMVDAIYDAYVDSGVTEEESKEFTRSFIITDISSDPTLTPEIASQGITFTNNYFDNPIATEFPNFYMDESVYRYSVKEKMYLDQLHTILSNGTATVSQVNAQITALERTIYGDMSLGTGSLFILFSGTQIARHSFEYWTNNMDKWVEIGGVAAAASTGGDIAKGDVGGGVGAAAGAWVVNVLPGAGQIAYGGAIVGGAVAGSVGVAVVKLLDWIWP